MYPSARCIVDTQTFPSLYINVLSITLTKTDKTDVACSIVQMAFEQELDQKLV